MNTRVASPLARRLLRPHATTSPFATYSLANHAIHPFPFPPITSLRRRNLSIYSFVPRVFSPTWWSEQIPKDTFKISNSTKSTKSKGWNPAWSFILLALFVGSQSINLMVFKRDREVYMRRANAKIDVLKEIIENIQSGKWAADGPEVQRALRLGKDSRAARQEWGEIMREIEAEDAQWQEETQKLREKIEQEEAAKAKFAALESPTAWSEVPQAKAAASSSPSPPKTKPTADDYYT